MQHEVVIYLFLSTVLIAVFIIGTLLLVFQYRRRKIVYEAEKAATGEQHRLDLLNNQIATQRQTMQFIGAEIHDSVTQKLSLASIYTQKLEYENRDPGIRDSLLSVSGIINESLNELRELSHTLTNEHIQHTSLLTLLQDEQERVNSTGLCRIELSTKLHHNFSLATRSALLRIVQEAIQNCLKHSGCRRISITLDDSGDGLRAAIADDGKGFDTQSSGARGIGMSNMRRRIHHLGGDFELRSAPGSGTTLLLFIPHQNL